MHSNDTLSTDVLIVGAGPAGLSSAIHLADVFKQSGQNRRIMVIEKGNAVGAHILSGAIIKTEALKELLSEEEFENLPFDCDVSTDTTLKLSATSAFTLPLHPPVMNNIGHKIASLCQVCRYLATLAEKRGVEVYAGFAVNEILYENDKVVGVKTIDTGINYQGEKQKNYQKGTSVMARVVILAEGTRGTLAKQLKSKFDLRKNTLYVFDTITKQYIVKSISEYNPQTDFTNTKNKVVAKDNEGNVSLVSTEDFKSGN